MIACPVILIGFALTDPGFRPRLRMIEKHASVKFPESTKLLNSYGRRFLEIHILAKVEMDRADVDQFISSLPEPRETVAEPDISYRSYHFTWWNPSSARQPVAIEITSSDDLRTTCWMVLVDSGDPQRAVVYLDYSRF